MSRIQVLEKVHYFLILFFTVSGCCIENSSVITNRTSSKFSNGSTNFSIYSIPENFMITTTTTTTTTMSPEINSTNLNSSITVKKNNKSFTPSVHLGVIEDSHGYETRNPKVHPFNNVQHLEFGNPTVGNVASNNGDDVGSVSVVNPQSVREQVKFVYETDGGDTVHPLLTHHNSHHSLPQPTYDESYVTVNVPLTPSHIYYNNHDHVQQQQQPEYHEPIQFNHHPHPNYQHYNIEPELQHVIYEKPSKYEDISPGSHHHNHHYEFIPPSNDEIVKKPEITGPLHEYQHHYHDNQQHPETHNQGIAISKPETVLYLTSHRETSFTRTRKFPYKHYQPQDDTEIHLVKDEHAFPPQRRQISPWHKIIHIIGAFLPLGLLIAALKPPNVIKMDSNNTNPNIVLSKLRSFQLPIEHKELENTHEDLCENKRICETILRGAERNTKLIDNVLEDVAKRSLKQDKMRKSEFNEIFEAVRKKDCSFIKC